MRAFRIECRDFLPHRKAGNRAADRKHLARRRISQNARWVAGLDKAPSDQITAFQTDRLDTN